MLTVCIDNLEEGPSNYRMVSFPTRVRINAVSFAVNFEAAGSIEDNRTWGLAVVVGSAKPTPENPRAEWISPLFPSEKPIIDTPNQYMTSTVVSPPVQIGRKFDGTAADIDYGVLAPGDYVSIWISLLSGNVDTITWENTSATVSIDYEETANKSINEIITQFPELD